MPRQQNHVLDAVKQTRRAQKRTLQTSARRAHDVIRSGIRMGIVRHNSSLVEQELVRGLDTSRNAVREALQLLADEGLVERSPRTGTRLVSSILEIPLGQFLPLVGDGTTSGQRVTIELLESGVVEATPLVATKLDVPAGEELEMAEQLVRVDGKPVAVRCCYMVKSFVRTPVEYSDAQQYTPQEMSTAIRSLVGPDAIGGRIENVFEAMPCEPITGQRLHVRTGTPILVRELLMRTADGRPYLFGYARYRGDRIAVAATSRVTALTG